MKFLKQLLEENDHDIFDDLLDDHGAQSVMGVVTNAHRKGVSWDRIAQDKEDYEEEAEAELTQDEWDAMIRVLKAQGAGAKMAGIDEAERFTGKTKAGVDKQAATGKCMECGKKGGHTKKCLIGRGLAKPLGIK